MANESLLIKEAVQNLTARKQRTEKANDLVIEWSKALSDNDSWPKGKSLKGFEKWLRTSYRKAQEAAKTYTQKTGLKHEAGHGEQGANAPSNLGNQIKKGQYGNRTTNDRVTGEVVKKSTDHLRITDDLDAADVGYKMEKAFEEYLHEGNPNLKIEDQKQFSAKQREAILHRPDYASTAEGAQMKARKHNLENAFKKAAEEHPIPKSHQKIVDQQMDSVLEGHRSRVTTPRSSPKPSVKQQVLGVVKKNGGNGVNGTNGTKKLINTSRILPIVRKTADFVEPVAKPILKWAPIVGAGIAIEGMNSAISNATQNPTAENIAYATGKTVAAGLELDPTGITPTIVDTATETFFTEEGRKNWRSLSAKSDFSTL